MTRNGFLRALIGAPAVAAAVPEHISYRSKASQATRYVIDQSMLGDQARLAAAIAALEKPTVHFHCDASDFLRKIEESTRACHFSLDT